MPYNEEMGGVGATVRLRFFLPPPIKWTVSGLKVFIKLGPCCYHLDVVKLFSEVEMPIVSGRAGGQQLGK